MTRRELVSTVLVDAFGEVNDELWDTRLDELPLDSMGVVELVGDIEFSLGITFDSSRSIDTSQTLSQFIESLPED